MIDFGCKHFFKVKLFLNPSSSEVIYTSEALDCLHDANELLHWLSCQLSGMIPYQIVECTRIDGQTFENPFPRSVKKHTYCKYYPPHPLYMRIKKMRRNDKYDKGLYYI